MPGVRRNPLFRVLATLLCLILMIPLAAQGLIRPAKALTSTAIEYLGHSMFIISSLGNKALLDPGAPGFGLPQYDPLPPTEAIAVTTVSHEHDDHWFPPCVPQNVTPIMGTVSDVYDSDLAANPASVGGFAISSIGSKHFENDSVDTNAVFMYTTDNLRIVHLGDSFGTMVEGFTADQVYALTGGNPVDVLMVPVGGANQQALPFIEIEAAIDAFAPKIVIPMHSWNATNLSAFIGAAQGAGYAVVNQAPGATPLVLPDPPGAMPVIWNMTPSFPNPPTITSVSPTSVAAGAQLTITGTFAAGAAVCLAPTSGDPPVMVTVDSINEAKTEILATVPSDAPAAEYDVVVTLPPANGYRQATGISSSAITVTSSGGAPLTPPALTADTIGNTFGQDVDITFPNDAAWIAAITGISIDGGASKTKAQWAASDIIVTAGDGSTPGNIHIGAANFSSPGAHTVAVIATGYSNAQTSQTLSLKVQGALSDGSVSMDTTTTIDANNSQFAIDLIGSTVNPSITDSDYTLITDQPGGLLPSNLSVHATRGSATRIAFTVSGSATTPISAPIGITIMLKPTAVNEAGMAPSDPISGISIAPFSAQAPTMTSISISGTINPYVGESNLMAVGHYSDLSSNPVAASWSSSNTTLATVDSSGKVTVNPGQMGSATITATFGQFTATSSVTVNAAAWIKTESTEDPAAGIIVNTMSSQAGLQLQLYRGGAYQYELGGTGSPYSASTTFKVQLRMDSQPFMVLGTGDIQNWSWADEGGGPAGILTVTVKPMSQVYEIPTPYQRGIYAATVALLVVPDDVLGSNDNYRGAYFSTNGNSFAPPQMVNGRLMMAVGGVSTQNGDPQGNFKAFIPSALLDTWKISSPAQLTAELSGTGEQAITPSVTPVTGGMELSFDMHFSNWTVDIGPAPVKIAGSVTDSSAAMGSARTVGANNSFSITLTAGTPKDGTLVPTTDYTVAGLPAGLSVTAVGNSSTKQIVFTVSGTATADVTTNQNLSVVINASAVTAGADTASDPITGISLIGVGGAPTLVADATQNIVGQAAEITFANDSTWFSAISSVYIDATQYPVGNLQGMTLEAGKLTIPASLLPTAKTYQIRIVAAGYLDTAVSQAMEPVTKIAGTVSDNSVAMVAARNVGANSSFAITLTTGTPKNGTLTPTTDYTVTGLPSGLTVAAVGNSTTKQIVFTVGGTADADVTSNASLSVTLNASAVTSGANTASDAITGITLTGVIAAPALTADTTGNIVGQAIDITFSDSSAWRGAVTSVSIDATQIASGNFATQGIALTAGKLTIPTSLLTTAKTYQIVVVANGYLDARVSQTLVAVTKVAGSATDATAAMATGRAIGANDSFSITLTTGTPKATLATTDYTVTGLPAGLQIAGTSVSGNVITFTIGGTAGADVIGAKSLSVVIKATAVSSGANTDSDAITGITLTGVLESPTLTPDTTGNIVGSAAEITFTDNQASTDWLGAITSLSIDGGAAILRADFQAQVITVANGKIIIGASLLPTAKTYTIRIVATGYADATVSQAITSNTPPPSAPPTLPPAGTTTPTDTGTKKAEVNADGSVTVTATVDANKVDVASLTGNLTIDLTSAGNVTGEIGERKAEVPLTVLEKLADADKDVVLDTGVATLEIPPAALTDLPAVQSGNGTVRITVEPIATTGDAPANADATVLAVRESLAGASADGLNPAGKILAFTAEVTGTDGTDTRVTHFSKKVTVRIPFDASANPDLLGVYRLNRQTGEWEYRGGKVNRAGGYVEIELDGFSEYAVMAYKLDFSDVPSSHWASNDITLLTARHIVTGNGNGFAPDASVTRAEFAAMIVRALGLTAGTNSVAFSDVKTGDWYLDAVTAAAGAGLVVGENGKFRPNDSISRQEMAVILSRALKLRDKGLTLASAEVSDLLAKFADKKSIASWAGAETAELVKLGLINGQTTTTFAPTISGSRAEVAALVTRLLRTLGEIQ